MKLRDLERVSSIFVTHRLGDARMMSSFYFKLNDRGEPELHREDDNNRLTNTRFILLKDGRIIFSGLDEDFWRAPDPYIREFVRE
jgi:phospholipid/cholesterol/gamma-HCH transport system ATP-binding protein